MKVVKLKMIILMRMMMRWVTSQGRSSSLLSSLMPTVSRTEKMKCRMVNRSTRESRGLGLSDVLSRNEIMPRVICNHIYEALNNHSGSSHKTHKTNWAKAFWSTVLTDKSHCCLSIQCLMISMINVQTSCNVRRIMMKMIVVRLMAADIREVRITILLSDRHWPWLTLHLILENIFMALHWLLFWIALWLLLCLWERYIATSNPLYNHPATER